MVNRPAGGPRSVKWERAPYDWYRESPRAVEQLFHGLAAHGVHFDDDLIWDPCCGVGNVLDVAKRYGHPTVGSDVIDRAPRHRFFRGNVLTQVASMPRHEARQVSVMSNTPYSYEDDIAERIMLRILEAFPVRRAAFIVPIAFLAGQERWGRILPRFRPSHTCIYRERHTMPPGHLIDQMANPFAGGMADYAAVVFTRPHRWRTETVWLPPGSHPHPPKRAQTTRS
ncbi:MAG: hypothetical protein ACJ8DZ_13815 [Allosphingosinicella sp.]